MSEQPAVLEQLSEWHRRDPDFRGALLVRLDMLGPDDERTHRHRQTLFNH